MPYTDDPIADYAEHDREYAESLKHLPICDDCDNPIQEDHYFEFGNKKICPHCLDFFHKVNNEDFI